MMRLICLTAILFAVAAVSAQTPPASPIPAPSDVAAPPADASKTASGLATKVITPGTGKDHPGKDEAVTVNYTGWTADGKMFDSSVARGKPVTVGGQPRDSRLRRRFAPDGSGGNTPALDSRIAGLQRPGGKTSGDAGVRCDVDRPANPGACRCESATARCQADPQRPRLQSADARNRHTPSQNRSIRSPSTTPGGRPTGKCSTARWHAASHRLFRSTA